MKKLLIAIVVVFALFLVVGSMNANKPADDDTNNDVAAQDAADAQEPASSGSGLIAPENIDSLKFGELVSVINNGYGDVVINAKIEPSYNNGATIDQNYYNVCDFIRRADLDGINDVQYWAVADMSDGSEGKVIQFTVPSDLFETIRSDGFADNTLGQYVQDDDFWVLPSLLG